MSFYRIQNYPAADLLVGEQTSLSYSTDTERSGKSVCTSVDDLAAYVARTGMDLGWNGALLVELDGTYSDEDDEDAHLGAYLVHPTRIISAVALDETDFFDRVNTYLDAA